MDPLSQGIVGSVAAQQKSSKEKILLITIIGFLSGMAPDLDVFIRSSHDPLLAIEFHRQFTHSLAFIPIGALIVTFLSSSEKSFKRSSFLIFVP